VRRRSKYQFDVTASKFSSVTLSPSSNYLRSHSRYTLVTRCLGSLLPSQDPFLRLISGTTLYFTPHRQAVGKQRIYVRLFPLVDHIVLYYTGVEKGMWPSAQYRHVRFIRCKLGDPCSSQTPYPQSKVWASPDRLMHRKPSGYDLE
jgi:hypothetical protein